MQLVSGFATNDSVIVLQYVVLMVYTNQMVSGKWI